MRDILKSYVEKKLNRNWNIERLRRDFSFRLKEGE